MAITPSSPPIVEISSLELSVYIASTSSLCDRKWLKAATLTWVNMSKLCVAVLHDQCHRFTFGAFLNISFDYSVVSDNDIKTDGNRYKLLLQGLQPFEYERARPRYQEGFLHQHPPPRAQLPWRKPWQRASASCSPF